MKRESTGGVDAHGLISSVSVLNNVLTAAQCILAHGDHVEASAYCFKCSQTPTYARWMVREMDGSSVWLITSRACDYHASILRLCATISL